VTDVYVGIGLVAVSGLMVWKNATFAGWVVLGAERAVAEED